MKKTLKAMLYSLYLIAAAMIVGGGMFLFFSWIGTTWSIVATTIMGIVLLVILVRAIIE